MLVVICIRGWPITMIATVASGGFGRTIHAGSDEADPPDIEAEVCYGVASDGLGRANDVWDGYD